MTPTPEIIGSFVDSVAGKTRTPAAVAGRLLEEIVELALDAGLDAGKIMGHVTDSLHNQALKATEAAGRTVFPSQISGNPGELGEECADASILLKDLCYVANIDLAPIESDKWARFTQKKFRVSANGTIYAVKPHIHD